MPNWCESCLKAEGDRKDVDTFLSECFSANENKRKTLDFEKIIPLGEPGEDWYDQHRDNWGTKWNVSDCDIDDDGGPVTVWFETAWSPPIPILEALTKKYTALSFTLEYNEGGMGFRGVFESRQGEVIRDDSWEMTREDMVELGYLDVDADEDEEATGGN
ncbi:conserved hypothetical protein [Treponema primitia ZAS-2]|uniref:YubB ferredoxin-like domain-containing protein n=1 Tax=Treponema primitia (strain ATCC BAA-887 / DSM 12427 / ZAS-2) TaxID=545694 RepID=F5YI98_TREPZ|nr:hypothetical protein [Treponema primitia]AEF85473.1 conserved hypothetical protein [Treponema primitia ZAS-2]